MVRNYRIFHDKDRIFKLRMLATLITLPIHARTHACARMHTHIHTYTQTSRSLTDSMASSRPRMHTHTYTHTHLHTQTSRSLTDSMASSRPCMHTHTHTHTQTIRSLTDSMASSRPCSTDQSRAVVSMLPEATRVLWGSKVTHTSSAVCPLKVWKQLPVSALQSWREGSGLYIQWSLVIYKVLWSILRLLVSSDYSQGDG